MSRRYHVTHRTSYGYERPVTDAYSVACLLPRQRPFQQVIDAEVTATPTPDDTSESTDVFGNRILSLGVHHRHDAFELVARSTVDVDVPEPPSTDEAWGDVAERVRALRGPDAIRVGPYLARTEGSTPLRRGDLLAMLADRVFVPGRPIVEAVRALAGEIFATWSFDPTATDWTTPLDTVLEQQRGVCQDFAHLATAVLRSVGIPASYVSGYIETEAPPGEVKSIGADASHAWASAWTGAGWLDLDPTNDQTPPTRHVTVAWGRDYADVAPVRGVVLGPSGAQTMDVAVDVARG
ncbi:transglutaminase family protein [Ilumatobacter sp.]|uniref:transglutaminase family protein n=1 Tax=Ilumatobacter sp. TaxID=1967498 RepID=UPI003B51AD57